MYDFLIFLFLVGVFFYCAFNAVDRMKSAGVFRDRRRYVAVKICGRDELAEVRLRIFLAGLYLKDSGEDVRVAVVSDMSDPETALMLELFVKEFPAVALWQSEELGEHLREENIDPNLLEWMTLP